MRKRTPRKRRPLTLCQRYARLLPTLPDEAFIRITKEYQRLAKERPHSSIQELFFAAIANVGRGTESRGEDKTER